MGLRRKKRDERVKGGGGREEEKEKAGNMNTCYSQDELLSS